MYELERLRMLMGTQVRVQEALSAVEKRIAELEAEASCLKKLKGEVAERMWDLDPCPERPSSYEFLKFNFVARKECLQIVRRLEGQGAGPRWVVTVPVIVRPEPSMN